MEDFANELEDDPSDFATYMHIYDNKASLGNLQSSQVTLLDSMHILER